MRSCSRLSLAIVAALTVAFSLASLSAQAGPIRGAINALTPNRAADAQPAQPAPAPGVAVAAPGVGVQVQSVPTPPTPPIGGTIAPPMPAGSPTPPIPTPPADVQVQQTEVRIEHRPAELIGLTVVDPQSQQLGIVRDVLIDPRTHEVRLILVAVGDEFVVLPFDIVRFETVAENRREILVNLSVAQFRDAPRIRIDQLNLIRDPQFITRVTRFYEGHGLKTSIAQHLSAEAGGLTSFEHRDRLQGESRGGIEHRDHMQGQARSEERRDHMQGQTRSDEHRDHMQGQTRSDEHRDYMQGQARSEERRDHMQGQARSDEHRDHMQGQTRSDTANNAGAQQRQPYQVNRAPGNSADADRSADQNRSGQNSAAAPSSNQADRSRMSDSGSKGSSLGADRSQSRMPAPPTSGQGATSDRTGSDRAGSAQHSSDQTRSGSASAGIGSSASGSSAADRSGSTSSRSSNPNGSSSNSSSPNQGQSNSGGSYNR